MKIEKETNKKLDEKTIEAKEKNEPSTFCLRVQIYDKILFVKIALNHYLALNFLIENNEKNTSNSLISNSFEQQCSTNYSYKTSQR